MQDLNLKYTLLIVLLTICHLNLFSQVINFPDQNLKSALIINGVDLDNDGEIDIDEALAKDILDLGDFGIENLVGLNHFINLKQLYLFDNNISQIGLDSLDNLEIFDVNNNLLQSINLTPHPNLEILEASYNQITDVILGDTLDNLEYLDLTGNQLDRLSWDKFPSLTDILIAENDFTSLDLSVYPEIGILNCSTNPLEIIDFPQEVSSLFINETNLQSIDLTSIQVDLLVATLNVSLEVLLLRNDHREINPQLENNPNLRFICADDGQELEWLENYIAFLGYDTIISNDCTVSTEESDIQKPTINYNSQNNVLEILNKTSNASVTIIDNQGRSVVTTYSNVINMSHLPASLYTVLIGNYQGSKIIVL